MMNEDTSYISPVTWCLASALLVVSLTSMFKRRGSRDNCSERQLPPGPSGYPVVGTFPSFLKAPAHEVLHEWTKRYGKIVRYKLFQGETVVLGDLETIKESFITNSPDVDSRCQWRECFTKMFRGLSSLPYCEKWVNTRRRTLTILRDFGMGKSFLENKIVEENNELLERLVQASDNGKKNFNPRDMIRRAPMNTIYSIMFGKRHDFDDPKLLYVMNTISYLVDTLATISVYDILPSSLRRVAGFSVKNFYDKLSELSGFFRNLVEEHKRTYDPNITRDFVDAWLKAGDGEEIKSEGGPCPNDSSTEDASHRNRKIVSRVSDVIQDVMVAGAHSTSIVFHWAVLLLLLHKEEQDLAYEEIMEEIGPDRVISTSDKAKLRRVDAIVHECLRLATVLPLVAHATSRDAIIGGYFVKAGTEVIYNNWAINRDEKIFPEPKAFKPDRWLTEDGKLNKELLKSFFPFGVGKRSCAGESLARMELFIDIASLIQRVELLPPDDTVEESLKPEIKHKFGLLAECKPYMMRVRRRPT